MLEKLPKIELHMHLDGSLDLDYIKEKYNFSDEDIKNKLIANNECHNLNDYLTKFNFPISIMQTKEELENATIKILEKLKKQNVIYVELRFAPQLHTKKGLSQEEVVETIINAKNKVDIKCNLILCYMRGNDNMNLNYETLNVAKKYLGCGVCAVDLAGAEGLYKTSNYKELFDKTLNNNIPFTIHAGEADGPDSIISAINFGANRIGHGVRVIEDKKLLQFIIDEEIPLEICPTSNIQTCIFDSYKNHPAKKLYDMGVNVTINTDNMTVSNTSLENEYKILIKELGFTIEDIIKMNKNSINASFLKDNDKKELLNIFRNYIN